MPPTCKKLTSVASLLCQTLDVKLCPYNGVFSLRLLVKTMSCHPNKLRMNRKIRQNALRKAVNDTLKGRLLEAKRRPLQTCWLSGSWRACAAAVPGSLQRGWILTVLRSYFLPFYRFSPSHHLNFSPSHLLTLSPSHLLTFSPSHLLTLSTSHLHFATFTVSAPRFTMRMPRAGTSSRLNASAFAE